MYSSSFDIQDKGRIASLDMMRGFAIFGISLVNMLAFHSPVYYLQPFEWWQNPLDQSIYSFIDIFAQASFYPLFSMLFGYGIVILRERILQRSESFSLIAVRRFSLLLLFGCIHAWLIWHGDILFTYAVLGFIFLLFIKLNGKILLLLGSLLYLIPNLLLVLLMFATMMLVPADIINNNYYNHELAEASVAVYQSGSFSDITQQRIADWYYANNPVNFIFLTFSILPLFFIGAGAAKLKWLERVNFHKRKLFYTFLVTFTIGLLLKLLPYITGENIGINMLQDLFGGPLLAFSYGLSIALLAEKPRFRKILMPFSYAGRLSLSNYLLQSLIATAFFYGYGLGLYGKISVFTGTLLALAIFICEVLVSKIWLRRFYYGPFEWVWRSFTYWKIPRWKRERTK
ncbi:DUF418 domain-containing protein [Bacillaceae bacterium Marseille-Q3522]|nr:DUF418 domain-containing protein [Bacillaceae bacterium Marseille-Q3522]